MKEAPYAWVVVWATFFALAIIFGVSYSFAAFFASFADEFGAQRADVSLVFGLSGAVYFVFGAAAGMLADRFGPRAVTCAGMLLIAAGLALCSFAGSMPMVYAAYGVGVGLGIAWLTGVGAFAFGKPFLTSAHGHPTVPILGELPLASAALFDLGVYITVVGATMLMLSVLGAASRERAKA